MRIANGVFAVLLLLFAAVQYNDPDGPFWVVVYGIGCIWCVIATFKPTLFQLRAAKLLFSISCAGAVYGLVHFWPKTPNWWRQEVWWETETAREGMGMMVLLIALILAGIIALRISRQSPT